MNQIHAMRVFVRCRKPKVFGAPHNNWMYQTHL